MSGLLFSKSNCPILMNIRECKYFLCKALFVYRGEFEGRGAPWPPPWNISTLYGRIIFDQFNPLPPPRKNPLSALVCLLLWEKRCSHGQKSVSARQCVNVSLFVVYHSLYFSRSFSRLEK